MKIEIDIYNHFSADLKSIWTKFEINAMMTPFQSYAWLSHWGQTIGTPLQKADLQLVIIKAESKILAIFPLCINCFRGIKVLQWMGGVQSDYKAPLLDQNWYDYKIDFKDLWKEICNRLEPHDVIHLDSQIESLESLLNPFVSSFDVDIYRTASSAALSGNWESYYNKKIKKKMRADSRRSLRRLKEMGELSFIIADSESESDLIIDEMIIQKSKRYLNTGLRDILAIPEYRNFYKQLPQLKYNSEMKLHCSAIKIDRELIATHVGLIYKRRFYYLMPAYNSDDWSSYSPGRLLLERLIEWSYSSNFTIFDFTVGAEEYKDKWCDGEVNIYEYFKINNFKGFIHYLIIRSKNFLLNSKLGSTYLREFRKKFKYR